MGLLLGGPDDLNDYDYLMNNNYDLDQEDLRENKKVF